jgi:acyl-CoA synthetase (AMP-forming)/AMP-acid ligase II
VLPDFDPRRPAEIRPAVILGQMRAASVTTASGSPAFFERLCEHVLATGETLPLQAFFTGGAPVPPELARTFARCCAGAQVLYGSTEAEPIAALPAQELVQRTEAGGGIGLCAGTPIREIELLIARPTDGPIALGAGGWSEWRQTGGEPGEIVVTGPHVLAGYLDNPEADRENKVRDGDRVWHRTGDGGFLDDQGRLWLTGRVKHRVRRAGDTWWGLPVELRALSVPAIAHAAYLGLPDPRLGQRAVLCVEIPPAAMGPATERELVAAAAPAPVDQVIALERIPRDPRHASKTDMDALIARIQRG